MDQHIGELLHEYLDDELNESERIIIEKHLNMCLECKNELLELTELKKHIYDAYQYIEIPYSIEEKVIGKIELESVKTYSGLLNRTAVIMMGIFAIIFLAGTTPFLSVGVHIFHIFFSIGRGLLYAIPSIISAIPYIAAAVAVIIILLIALAVFMIKYLLHNMGKTVGAEDI